MGLVVNEPIHPWRWRALTVWVVVFTLIVFFALRAIENQSAKVTQLQKTNCGLEQFLLTARTTRWQSYQHTHLKADLNAVVGYELLLRPFIDNHEATGRCPIPRHLIIKTRPLRGVN
jgi:hypothetical protein